MKDVIELLVELSRMNKTVDEQKRIIDNLQDDIIRYKEKIDEMNEKLLWYAQERAKFKTAWEESENSGANLLIKQIVDDIVESGLVKLEVEE